MADSFSSNDTNGRGPDPADSVVSRAVELGYKVIQEQIEQGQHIAEQLTSGNIDPGMMNSNASELTERVLRFYSDMGALWIEMLESVFRNPAMGEMFSKLMPDANGRMNGFAGNGASAPRTNGHSHIPVEIVSSEPTGARVSVDLHTDCSYELLAVYALHAKDPKLSPIAEITFVAASDEWPATIRVFIPAGQASGTYSGLVMNTASDEPAGTMCVLIPPQAPESES